jgi:hypothetical protein
MCLPLRTSCQLVNKNLAIEQLVIEGLVMGNDEPPVPRLVTSAVMHNRSSVTK